MGIRERIVSVHLVDRISMQPIRSFARTIRARHLPAVNLVCIRSPRNHFAPFLFLSPLIVMICSFASKFSHPRFVERPAEHLGIRGVSLLTKRMRSDVWGMKSKAPRAKSIRDPFGEDGTRREDLAPVFVKRCGQ